jgi:hypothetical protein
MGGRATQSAIALAALAVALFAPSAAQGARSEFYGITQTTGIDGNDIFGMAGAKVRTDRFPFVWDQIEPTKGSFSWTEADQHIGTLAAFSVRSAPFVWGAPGWAGTGGLQRPPVTPSAQTAWQTFLKAAVARYGPGGTYWKPGGPYHQAFGANAVALPITSWQIWNEPNLTGFYPGGTYKQKATRYGQLVQSSHDAIKSKDPKAQIVLAGLTTQKDPNVYNFLNSFYAVRHIKDSFDVVAQHPYASDDAKIKTAINHVRSVMASHADKATPLWITEFAWGSGPTDSAGINKGSQAGQATALTNSYKMLLANRTAWNLQRVYWFLWRDPQPGTGPGCSFCGTAGLFQYDHTAKLAYNAFKAFTADSTAPQATITAGPPATTHDTTPTLSFKSNEAGSTFQCHFDSKPFASCASPYTPGTPLTKANHTFYVKAIDAAGNESAVKSRSFRVN